MHENTAHKTLLALADQSIGYGSKVVLDRINLHLHAGERIALLGKSGVGKSTLLKHLHEKLVEQEDVVSWIPQQLGLVDKLSVFHNVMIGRLDQQSGFTNLRNLLWPSRLNQQTIQTLLSTMNMADTLFSSLGDLSGGQQQRIAVARALYRHASILLADEPVSSLDKPLAKKVLDILKQRFGCFVIALHDVDLAMSVADRIIGIREGKIVIDAAPADLDAKVLAPLYLEQVDGKPGSL